MKKFVSISVCVVVILAAAGAAHAGLKWNLGVYIVKNTDGSGYVQGALGSTRNSSDTVSRLQCYYQGLAGYQYSTCFATDGTNFLSCQTSDPVLNETISKLQGDQYLYFAADSAANCTAVQIGSASMWAPKAP